ncbi:hypothetical protein YC2023_012419 [Brassica napus]
MIKTCGNTKVFETISLILFHSKRDAINVKFTCGSYLWPEQQPYQCGYSAIGIELQLPKF